MKRIDINDELFKTAIEGVKHAAAKDESRPILKYIKVVATAHDVTFYTLDGYRAAKVQIKQENAAEFSCYIKPIAFKPLKGCPQNVVIEYDEQAAYISVITEYGALRYEFKQPNATFVDIEKIYADAHAHDRELGMNANYVAEACKAIAKQSLDRNALTIFESKEDVTKAFILRAESGDILNEQLILPVKLKP